MRHLLILAFFCSFLSGCEPLSLKGTIINEQNEPIPNATITLKRTNQSVTTNDKGQFIISNLHFDDTLIISAAGYIPETESYDYSLQGYELTIRLKRKISMLDGTVVIANGCQQLNASTLQSFTVNPIVARSESRSYIPSSTRYGFNSKGRICSFLFNIIKVP